MQTARPDQTTSRKKKPSTDMSPHEGWPVSGLMTVLESHARAYRMKRTKLKDDQTQQKKLCARS